MSDDKSLGERLSDAANAVKSKVNEGADRVRAEVQDLSAETSDNPSDGAVEKGKATVDRAKTEYHEGEADASADEANR